MKTTDLFKVQAIDVSMKIEAKIEGLTKLLNTATPVPFTTGAALVQYSLEEDGDASVEIQPDGEAVELKYKQIKTDITPKIFAPYIEATNDAINKGDIESTLTAESMKTVNKVSSGIAKLFVESITGEKKATKLNGFNDEMRKNLLRTSLKVSDVLDDQGTGEIFVLMNSEDFAKLDGAVNSNLAGTAFGFQFYTTDLGVKIIVTSKIKEGTIAAYDAGNIKFAYRDQENAPSTLSSNVVFEGLSEFTESTMFKISEPVEDVKARKQFIVVESEVAIYPEFPEAVVVMTIKDRPVTPGE